MKRFFRIVLVALIGLVAALALYFGANLPPKSMQGTWYASGYGLAIDITPLKIDIYETSQAPSCIHWVTLPANIDLVQRMAGYSFGGTADQLLIDVAEITNDVTATPLDSLPQECEQARDRNDAATFDVVWSTFDQYYPNFALYNVDWDARRADALVALQDQSLSDVLTDALRGLDDAHVGITTPDGEIAPHAPPAWTHDQRALFDVGASKLTTPLVEDIAAGVLHGWLPNNIAYIAFVHMGPQPSFGQLSVHQAEKIARGLAEDYQSADGIIIDLRYNSGGSDTVGLTYASLLSKDTWLVGRKAVQTARNKYTDWIDVVAPGRMDAINVPTAVLTSSATVSAAEIAVLAMRELPQVTVIGEATAGALSDAMERQLPNSWAMTLPHQIYAANNGDLFEGTGIPPDIAVAMDQVEFGQGQDRILITAIAHLRGD